MKWILLVLGVLVLAVGVLALIGVFLPRDHTATCRVRLRAPVDVVFAALANFEAYPVWRPDVKSVRILEPIDGKPAYVEEHKHGPQTYAVETSRPPDELVLRVSDDALPYGGTWTFALETVDGATQLSITEDGFVKPAIFRTLSRYVFGHHATLEQYLKALVKKLGEDVPIERVETQPA